MNFRFLISLSILCLMGCLDPDIKWNKSEIALISTLIIDHENIDHQISIQHTSNEVWNNPKAASLGQKLFFDKRLSGNGVVACSSCHQPSKAFSDGKTYSEGMGSTSMHTPSIIGIANSPWLFWDGRIDSLWAQALGPFENPNEHGTNRVQLVHLIATYYKEEYEALFGPLDNFSDRQRFPFNAMPISANQNSSVPLNAKQTSLSQNWQAMHKRDQDSVNEVFSNLGKSIAAYENLIMPGPSRFDEFAKELSTGHFSTKLTLHEQAGLKLFIDQNKGQCINCHSGPLFTNHEFQATGITDILLSKGRIDGIEIAHKSPFNCKEMHEAPTNKCQELVFSKRHSPDLNGAFKVPTLRNISLTAPYMHNGSLSSLKEVLAHYNQGQSQLQGRLGEPLNQAHMGISPLRLLPHELNQISSFLLTLTSPLNTEARWLTSPFSEETSTLN